VAYDCGSDYQGLMATVSTDNTKSAKEAADKLAEAMSSKGKVLILAHNLASAATDATRHVEVKTNSHDAPP